MKTKKILVLLGALIITLSISGCSFLFDNIESLINGGEQGETGKGDGAGSDGYDTVDDENKTIIKQTYKDLGTNSLFRVDYCPTIGSPKLLVIPVWFTDSTKYIGTSKRDAVREDIQKAYFGTNEETGWRSVKTFYEEESRGKLVLDGVVSEWYETGQNSSAYQSEELGGRATEKLVTTATNWFFSTHTNYSRKDFDLDSNGFLDGIMLIYASPNYSSLDKKGKEYANLWAYCYWLQQDTADKESPNPNVFFWASYDFMYGKNALLKTGSSYGFGDTNHCNVDAHTYIHEMGHAFGLSDYYDYSDNSYSPAAGFSMQDGNVGGHDPYSVMSLGWANPYVVTGDADITIKTFQKSRDIILITPNWNEYGSPFDEYILLELYSPTGLNKFDSDYIYSGFNQRGPTNVGIRMWHVDARLVYVNSTKDGAAEFKYNQLTTNVTDPRGTYGVTQAFSNSYEPAHGSLLGSSYYDFNMLQLIRNSETCSDKATNAITNSDLFYSGNFYLSDFPRQYVKMTKFNSGATLNYFVQVQINGSGHDATAKVTISKK